MLTGKVKQKLTDDSLQPLKVLHNQLRLYRIRVRQVSWAEFRAHRAELKSHALDMTDDQLAYCVHRRHTLPQLIQFYYTRGSE
jgi:hypothetical protein